MIEAYVEGLLSFSIVFIACFIALYSYMFLTKTIQHKERKPWDFLFVASAIQIRVIEAVAIAIFEGIRIGARPIVVVGSFIVVASRTVNAASIETGAVIDSCT